MGKWRDPIQYDRRRGWGGGMEESRGEETKNFSLQKEQTREEGCSEIQTHSICWLQHFYPSGKTKRQSITILGWYRSRYFGFHSQDGSIILHTTAGGRWTRHPNIQLRIIYESLPCLENLCQVQKWESHGLANPPQQKLQGSLKHSPWIRWGARIFPQRCRGGYGEDRELEHLLQTR